MPDFLDLIRDRKLYADGRRVIDADVDLNTGRWELTTERSSCTGEDGNDG